DPLSTINLLLTVRWVIRSWTIDVSNTTIYNCFRKSTLVSSPIQLPTPIIPSDMQALFKEVQTVGRIQNAMQLSNFLNPEGEVVEDDILEGSDADEVLQDLINDHLHQQLQAEDEEDEGEPVVQAIPTAREALQAAQVLGNFLESQGNQASGILFNVAKVERY
ncbi:CENP-B protein, partial [Microbacterium laevaniformans OR221]